MAYRKTTSTTGNPLFGSHLQSIPTYGLPNSAPVYELSTGRGADDYEAVNAASYNNAFNYWLWNQQNAYNDPSAQMARLKAAGLNPNVITPGSNTAAGASPSQMKPYQGHQQNALARFGMGLNLLNTVLGGISSLVSSASKLSGIPDNIPLARNILTRSLRSGADYNEYKSAMGIMDLLVKGKKELGINPPAVLNAALFPYMGTTQNVALDYIDAGKSFDNSYTNQYRQLNLANLGLKNSTMQILNKLRSYQIDNLMPEQLALLKNQVAIAANNEGLTGKQLDWFNTVTSSKIGASLAPILLSFAKLIL